MERMGDMRPERPTGPAGPMGVHRGMGPMGIHVLGGANWGS